MRRRRTWCVSEREAWGRVQACSSYPARPAQHPAPSLLQSGTSAATISAAATGRLAGPPAAKRKPAAGGAGAGTGGAGGGAAALPDHKKIRVKFDEIFQDVAAFGASAFTGKDKKEWERKQLNALGANLKHVEKMPRKMAIGVLAARKKREDRKAEELRVSGVVTGKKIGKKKEWRAGRRTDAEAAGHPGDITPSNVKGAVMFVRGAR